MLIWAPTVGGAPANADGTAVFISFIGHFLSGCYRFSARRTRGEKEGCATMRAEGTQTETVLRNQRQFAVSRGHDWR
jgi:hypothetical protein